MKGEDIDGSALAADREGDLDQAPPAVRLELANDTLDERGVIGVEEPIEGLPMPVDPDGESRPVRVADSAENGGRDAIGTASLHPGDERLRHACAVGERVLGPAKAAAKGRIERPKRTESISQR